MNFIVTVNMNWSSRIFWKRPCSERNCEIRKWGKDCGKHTWLTQQEEQWGGSRTCCSVLSWRSMWMRHHSPVEGLRLSELQRVEDTGLWDVLSPPRISRPIVLEQDYTCQVRHCRRKAKISWSHLLWSVWIDTRPSQLQDGSSSLLTVSSRRQEVHALYGAHTHFPGPLMITKWGEALWGSHSTYKTPWILLSCHCLMTVVSPNARHRILLRALSIYFFGALGIELRAS